MLRQSFAILAMVALWPFAAFAQDTNPFAPQIIINDRIITSFELEQRVRFLDLVNAPGNLDEEAEKGLIDDRLRKDAGDALGVTLTEEAIIAGMEEFAGRASLSLEEFQAALQQQDIAPETLRDFIESGLIWREVVRRRFAARTAISEEEIDRALALSTRSGSARILISEIVRRADTPEFTAESQALADRLKGQIKTPGAFAEAARQHSVSPTGQRGGRVDWLDLANLPPLLSSILLTLGPGEVSDPVPLGNAIALFQVRDLEELDAELPDTVSVEYARYAVTESEAARVTAEIDTCDDLYGVAKGQPEERLLREVKAVTEIEESLALTLARLDDGETTVVTDGGGMSLIMLCGRTPELSEDFDRETLRNRLRNQRLAAYADSYLAELKASAIIRRP